MMMRPIISNWHRIGLVTYRIRLVPSFFNIEKTKTFARTLHITVHYVFGESGLRRVFFYYTKKPGTEKRKSKSTCVRVAVKRDVDSERR